MKEKRIILFERMGPWTIYPARFFHRLGFKIVYMDLAPELKNRPDIERLSSMGIEEIDYNRFRYYEVRQFYYREIQMAERAWQRLVPDNGDLEKFRPLFGKATEWKAKLRPAAIDMIVKYIGRRPHLVIAADYFARHYDKVYLFATGNPVISAAVKKSPDDYTNLCPGFIGPLAGLFKVMGKVWTTLAVRWSRLKGIEAPDTEIEESRFDPERHRVVYFPHKGVAFGNLFAKDHFYNPDPNSPFYRERIFHIEQNIKGMDDAALHSAVRYYLENRIPFCFEPKYGLRGLISGLRGYIRFAVKNALAKEFRPPFLIARHMVFGGLYALYVNFQTICRKYSGAVLALAGYDALFPQTQSMALSALGLPVAATQERFIMACMPNFNYVLDYYYVWGEAAADLVKAKTTSHVGRTVPIGPIRLDHIYEFSRNGMGGRYSDLKKRYKKLVVVYDFPSGENWLNRNMNPMVTWDNNRAMYLDLVRLAEDTPDVYYIIRGKDDVWCGLPEFGDVYGRIRALPNMETDCDYGEYNISSKLVAMADLVIAKHTSIAEEALAAGKPVLFYDYLVNARKYVSDLYDFEGAPIFVYSYEELLTKVQAFVERGEYMELEQWRFLRTRLYGDSFDGRVRDRLHVELSDLFNRLTKPTRAGYEPESEIKRV